MRAALLLVDLQQDFLDRPGLQPSAQELLAVVRRVLAHARSEGMPVGHVRTRVDPAGHDRMPHWQRQGTWACVAGTPGEMPPPELAALPGEPVFHKRFFSGFADPALDRWLQETGAGALWVAGIYTHGCVRATVLDAYERGYQVTVVDDAIASTDPLHDQISRSYLGSRAASFAGSGELLRADAPTYTHCSPVQPGSVVARVEPSDRQAIDRVAAAARDAQADWSRRELSARRDVLRRFAEGLRDGAGELEELMVHHLGKPRRDARDELRRAIGHVTEALALEDRASLDGSTGVIYQPLGVVALVTPWNNPVAIPAGKLAAALLLGNAVAWKPAFQADAISRRLLALLHAAGLPAHLVGLVQGGPREVVALAGHPGIDAVSLTGPEPAGRAAAAACAPSGRPLQAELGGNNALLVLADYPVAERLPAWARLAFGFAGQRCTAVRRFVVEERLAARFESGLQEAVSRLQVTDPSRPDCDVGPLISAGQLERVEAAVEGALARGARLVAGGARVSGVEGHYYRPTLLAGLPPDDPVVQEELFGPVAVLQTARDFEQGLALVNGVRQGLLAGIATGSSSCRREFVRRAQAGIILDGGVMRIHPGAPFGGCKASQIGPPEHGIWDRDFFTRVRAVYRDAARS